MAMAGSRAAVLGASGRVSAKCHAIQTLQPWAHSMRGAQLVSERDKGIRAAALRTLELLHSAEGGAAAWRAIGSVSDQQRSLIEERFRHSEKQAARAAASRTATGSSAGTSQRTTEDAEAAAPYVRRDPAMSPGTCQPAGSTCQNCLCSSAPRECQRQHWRAGRCFGRCWVAWQCGLQLGIRLAMCTAWSCFMAGRMACSIP